MGAGQDADLAPDGADLVGATAVGGIPSVRMAWRTAFFTSLSKARAMSARPAGKRSSSWVMVSALRESRAASRTFLSALRAVSVMWPLTCSWTAAATSGSITHRG